MVVLLPAWNFGVVWLFPIGSFKAIQPATTLFPNRGLKVAVPELHLKMERDVDLENFLGTDSIVEKRVVIPESAGRNGIVNGPAKMGFQDVARRKRFDRHVLFPLVRIHWGFSADSGV